MRKIWGGSGNIVASTSGNDGSECNNSKMNRVSARQTRRPSASPERQFSSSSPVLCKGLVLSNRSPFREPMTCAGGGPDDRGRSPPPPAFRIEGRSCLEGGLSSGITPASPSGGPCGFAPASRRNGDRKRNRTESMMSSRTEDDGLFSRGYDDVFRHREDSVDSVYHLQSTTTTNGVSSHIASSNSSSSAAIFDDICQSAAPIGRSFLYPLGTTSDDRPVPSRNGGTQAQTVSSTEGNNNSNNRANAEGINSNNNKPRTQNSNEAAVASDPAPKSAAAGSPADHAPRGNHRRSPFPTSNNTPIRSYHSDRNVIGEMRNGVKTEALNRADEASAESSNSLSRNTNSNTNNSISSQTRITCTNKDLHSSSGKKNASYFE